MPDTHPSISTIKDVAKAAGVSIATVSRVARGGNVGLELKERVLSAMADLRYSPNISAQAMRGHTSHTVAFAVRGVMMPEMAPFVRTAESILSNAGYTVILVRMEESAEHQREILRQLAGRGIDGLLLTASAEDNDILSKAIARLGVPVVIGDRDANWPSNMLHVDHAGGMHKAIDYLVALGHERIGLVTVSRDIRPGRERIEAYFQALHRHRITPQPEYVSDRCQQSENCTYEASLILEQKVRPTAIIAGGMSLLPGVLRAAGTLGLRVGRDLSVIAGCDSELAELATPAITAIRWDLNELGRLSAQMLLQAIREGRPPAVSRKIVMPTELILRASCAAPSLE